MDRRSFLRAGMAGCVAGPALFTQTASASITGVSGSGQTGATPSGYGSLEGRQPDANGIILPAGFRSRIVAVGGEVVGATGVRWHPYPDGGACFVAADGGWIYVSNSEVAVTGAGGVSAIEFAADGSIRDARAICRNTTFNCSGGATTWGTWLTCEEIDTGLVWECDLQTRDGRATPLPALGSFRHEMAAVDEAGRCIYLTEDQPDGLLYRFTPTTWHDLNAGVLEAASISASGAVTWVRVLDPNAKFGTARSSAAGATAFNGGEGVGIFDRTLVFTTKGTDQVHRINLATMQYAVMREAGAPLSGVDNVLIDRRTGDIFIAEDGGNMELVTLAVDGTTSPFLRVVGHDGSEITGPAMSPDRTRLYFSSQRAPTKNKIRDLVPAIDADTGVGITYEITGPFHDSVGDTGSARIVSRAQDPTSSSSDAPKFVTLGAAGVAAMVGGAIAIRRRVASA